MKYIRIPFLANTYPQTTNYVTVTGNITLFGKYYDINKVGFTTPSLTSIKVVDGTKFRNIIAIYKDEQDSSPKYYTSEFYSRDLEASKIESNPYFINYSFEPGSILKIYLKDLVASTEPLKDAETKLGVSFIRNNFILYKKSGLISFKSSNKDTSQENLTISQLDLKIERLEEALLSIDTELNKIPRFSLRARRPQVVIEEEVFQSEKNSLTFTEQNKSLIKEKVLNRISQLKSQRDSLKQSLNNSNSNQIDNSKSLIRLNPSVIEDGVKKVLDKVIDAEDESDIIEIDGKFVDCIYLIKYIDWMFAKPTFEEIETGNVIAAEKLSVFKKDDKVQTDETQSENENNTPISTKRYYSYEIIRLSIPASLEQSVMSYRDQFGQTQTINADRYGYIREICAEEDSWGGQYSLFQRTQLGPCASDNTNNNNNTPLYGGGSGGGGRYDSGFIDYNRDQDFIARGERPNLQVQQ